MVVDDNIAIVGDGVFCFLLLLLLPVDGGDDDDDDDEDFDCYDLKSDNLIAIDGGMDGGDDVHGCCGDIMVGSNKPSSNDCTPSASRNRLHSVDDNNADGNYSDALIVSVIPVIVIVIVLSSHNKRGGDTNGIDSDKWIITEYLV